MRALRISLLIDIFFGHCCWRILRAHLRMRERFSGAFLLRTQALSSLKTTSKDQCSVFSMPQCWRTALAMVVGSGGRLERKKRVSVVAGWPFCSRVDTNTESKQVTNQGQKSPEKSQNNDPKNALNKIEISTIITMLLRSGQWCRSCNQPMSSVA